MAQAEIAPNGTIEQLTERLRNFESAGLPKPPNYLLSDYLCFLVDNELLPRETSDNVQAIYNDGRYGDAHIDEDILDKTLSQLDAALTAIREMDRPDIEALAETLASPQESVEANGQEVAQPSVQSTLTTFTAEPELPPLLPSESDNDVTQLMPVSNSRWGLWSRIIVCGILWTLVVLVAGYFGHDKMSALIPKSHVKTHKLVDDTELLERRREFIEDRRALIEEATSEAERQNEMRSLAQAHISRGEYGEYYYIYDSMLRKDPDNDRNKVKLAELLLDTKSSWYHDPVRARKLLEEAVTVDSPLYSRKLLAEALYQTGDKERAIQIRREVDSVYVGLPTRKQWVFKERGRRFSWEMDESYPTKTGRDQRTSRN